MKINEVNLNQVFNQECGNTELDSRIQLIEGYRLEVHVSYNYENATPLYEVFTFINYTRQGIQDWLTEAESDESQEARCNVTMKIDDVYYTRIDQVYNDDCTQVIIETKSGLKFIHFEKCKSVGFSFNRDQVLLPIYKALYGNDVRITEIIPPTLDGLSDEF